MDIHYERENYDKPFLRKDHIKFYGNNITEIDCVVQDVQLYTEHIHMGLSIEKCVVLTIHTVQSKGICWQMKDWNEGKQEKCFHMLTKILVFNLNARNTVSTNNSQVVSIIRCALYF